uniref:Transmembrane protein 106A n=1 Tax=Gasterosteus aculeatus aculeatus TaxID=481459 RepID=A0AAQ4NTX6_GASAC
METARTLNTPYGAINRQSADNCPTCRGIGRIPRVHDQLVAVIPCNDARLKPRRTKLYVCISMVVCLFLCCLILFFLFPRSVTLAPVSVLSVMVYFTPDTVDMEVTNLINVTNENFVPVQIVEFSVQGLISRAVVGTSKITNMTTMQARSVKSVSFTWKDLCYAKNNNEKIRCWCVCPKTHFFVCSTPLKLTCLLRIKA